MRAQFLLDAEQFDEAKNLDTFDKKYAQDPRLMFTLKDYYLESRRMEFLKSVVITIRKKGLLNPKNGMS